MNLSGTLGPDWLRLHGVRGTIPDSLLRAWRDALEHALQSELKLDPDFAIASETVFVFPSPNETHTIIEIEAFARRTLDSFLDTEARKTSSVR